MRNFLRVVVFSIVLIIFNACGGGGSSSNNNPSINTLNVPRVVSVNSLGSDKIEVDWLPSDSTNTRSLKEIKYKIYVETNQFLDVKNLKPKKIVTNQDVSYIEDLLPNTTYYIRVVAVDDQGYEAWSDVESIKTGSIKSELNVKNVKDITNLSKIDNNTTIETNTTLTKNQVVFDLKKGVLQKVVSIKKENNTTKATVENVSLQDVYKQFSYESKIKLIDTVNQAKTRSLGNNSSSVKWNSGLIIKSLPTDAKVIKTTKINSRSINKRYIDSKKNTVSFDYGTIEVSKQAIVEVGKTIEIPIKIIENKNKKLSVDEDNFNNECYVYHCQDVYIDGIYSEKNDIDFDNVNSNSSKPSIVKKDNGLYYIRWKPNAEDVSTKAHKLTISFKVYPKYNDKIIKGYEDTCKISTDIFVSQGKLESIDKKEEVVKFSKGMDISNTFTLGFTPTIYVSEKFDALRNKNTEKKISITGTIDLTQNLSINANANASIDETKNIYNKEFTKIVWAGEIPILLNGEFKVDIRFEGNANADIKVLEKYVNKFILTMGFDIKHKDDGSFIVTPINDFHKTYTLTINGEATGKLHAKITIIPDLQLKVYKAIATRLRLLPYAYSDAKIEGFFDYVSQSNQNNSFDSDYRFDNIEAGVGMKMSLFLGRAWGKTWVDKWIQLTYPEDAEVDKVDTHKYFTILKDTPLIKLPTLTAEVKIDKQPLQGMDTRAIFVEGNFKNSSISDLIKFDYWDKNAIVVNNENLGSTISYFKNGQYILIPNSEGVYNIRVAGYSNLGKWARQYTTTSITLEDNNNNGILDYWEQRYPKPEKLSWNAYMRAYKNGQNPSDIKEEPEIIDNNIIKASINHDGILVAKKGDIVTLDASTSSGKDLTYKWYMNDRYLLGKGVKVSFKADQVGVSKVYLYVSDGKNTDKTSKTMLVKDIKNDETVTQINSLSPIEAYSDKETVFTVDGVNLKKDITATLEDRNTCSLLEVQSQTATFKCKTLKLDNGEKANQTITVKSNGVTQNFNVLVKGTPIYKYIQYLGTSEPNDSCLSYFKTGCEKTVEPGKTYTKTWTFKNIGNVALHGLKVKVDSKNSSIITKVVKQIDDTLSVNQTTTFKLELKVPKDINIGIHKERFIIVDGFGNPINYKSTNGPSYFWYMLNVLPSFPKTITLQNVKNDGGLEGEVFTFSAVTSEPLDNSYKLMLSLGDNGGGWLAPKDMIPNSDRKKFAKAIKITKAGVNDGTRKYRVAIFYNGQQQSAWIEGSYKVYASSKIPQNLTAKQTTDGVLLSWSAVNGAKQYNPMASLNFKKDGNYATISSCEFKSDTSCLVDEHWFKEHKEWYFAIQADTYPMSEPIKFVWNDAVAPENKYSKYLADKTLYSVDNNSTVTEWAFDKDLSEITINSGEKTIAVKLDDNGLKIVSKENDYLIIKSVEDDYVVVEWVELTENGVILSHKGSAKLYFKDPTQGADLATLIVGKTFYQYCSQNKELITLTFGKDGDLVVKGDQETEHIPYTIKDNVLYVDEDGKKETHVLTKSDINYIQFGSKDEDKFYTNESDARANPVSDCDDDSDEIKVTNFISGHVDFVDKGYVPSDAWIGIVPSRYQNDASGWNRVTCKINSNGDFGNECYINHNEQGINEAFADSSETFQIVVFKNNVKSNEHDWNCGEDVYKYVGSNEPKDSWAHITVKDEDYQDRSDEECSDEKDIYTYTFDLDNQKFSGKSYSSSYVDHEVVHFNISTGNNKSLLISTTFKTNNELLNAFGSNNVLYLDNSKIIGVKFGDISTYNDTSEGGIESGSLKLIISEDKQQIHILQNNATIKISNKVLTGLDAYFARTNKVYNNNNDNQKNITKIEYSFNGDFLNDIGYCGTLSENDIILVGNSGSLVGWHNENYPLQMIIVLESDFSKLKCFMYDFHKYHNNEMGAGQNGTDEEMPEKSVVSQDSLLLKGSYSFTFDGMLDNDWNFKGSWYQEASDINGNYSGSGDFEIKLKRLNITDNNDNQKISDLVSGHLSFVDEDGNSISVPSNAWIRITPKEHQIEGSWNGVNCKINSSGNFGQECYIHSDEQEMRELFKSSAHTSYQIVIYKETIEDTRYNSEEEGIGDIIVDDDIESQKFDYGAWSNARVKIYTNDQNNNSSSNSKSVTYDVGNSLSVTISLNNNQLKAVFNKDMKSSYSTSGNYKPEKSFWLDDRTFVMDLEYYDAGGSIKFDADGFETTDGENMDKDIIFIFPQ